MAVINQFVVKDAATSRQDILRTLKNGLYLRNVAEPNVGPGSDYYAIATALGGELAVIGANCVIKTDAQMPDTAIDAADEGGTDDLSRIADILGQVAQPATGSVGSVILESSAPSPIAEGLELTDDLGQRYAVSLGGVYANAALVPIRALSTGEGTNRSEGEILRWSTAPAYASDKAEVATGGLINGADAEDTEALRRRVLATFQEPSGSGNPSQVMEVAEESTNSVEKAFAYPAFLGPSTCAVAVVAAPTETNKSRVVASTIMSGTVVPYMNALPQFGYLSTTTVADVNADVAIGLSLPEAPTANPPGPGGGWIDGTPWPAPDNLTSFRCTVTAVTSSTVFTVDALTVPLQGVSHIAWLSPTDWKLYTAVVAEVSGTSGAYVITLDSPFVGITVGSYIWPECENAQVYIDSLLAQFAAMGPGEKTANLSALGRGFRHPKPVNAWPYSLGPHLLQATQNASEEIASAQFFHRTDGTGTVTGSGAPINPQPPATLMDPPNIYVPRHIAFYRSAS
jgi:hypothetical protein